MSMMLLSPCLYNLYSEYIMRSVGLDEAEAEIKIARNTNNQDMYMPAPLGQKAKNELKSLLKVKEERVKKAGLKLSIQKTKTTASSPITSWQTDGETLETVTDFIFLGSKITVHRDCSHEIKIHLLLGREAVTNLDSIFRSRDIICQQKSFQSKQWFFQQSCMTVTVGP